MSNDTDFNALKKQGKFITVDNVRLHYLEEGEGHPILFIHGIPTSSYVWRKVIPYLSSLGRCIAIDLIGFGLSDKPDISYTIKDHIHFLERFITEMGLKNVTLVMHGFGSVVGTHYARTHEENCRGLVFYESFLRSILANELSLPLQEQISELQDINALPDLANNGVVFIDKMIPQSIMRELSSDEMLHYKQPFIKNGRAKQIEEYIHCLFRVDAKDELNHIIESYSQWLMKSDVPKLLLYTVPGFITTIATVMWAKENLPNLEIIEVGEELHLGQESYPEMIGESISAWLQALNQNSESYGGSL